MIKENEAMLPCPFCGGDAGFIATDSYGACHAGCNVENCFGYSQAFDEDELPHCIDSWNTRCINGVPLTFYRERAGVISAKAAWVVVHGGYMYGPHERWEDVELSIRDEWQDDRNLVG